MKILLRLEIYILFFFFEACLCCLMVGWENVVNVSIDKCTFTHTHLHINTSKHNKSFSSFRNENYVNRTSVQKTAKRRNQEAQHRKKSVISSVLYKSSEKKFSHLKEREKVFIYFFLETKNKGQEAFWMETFIFFCLTTIVMSHFYYDVESSIF